MQNLKSIKFQFAFINARNCFSWWLTWAEESGSPHFYVFGGNTAVDASKTKISDMYFSSTTVSTTLYLRRRYGDSYSSDDVIFYPYLRYPQIALGNVHKNIS